MYVGTTGVTRGLKSSKIDQNVADNRKAWFLALFELGIGAMLASVQKYSSGATRKGSIREYAFLGLLFLAARVLTNLSVRHHESPRPRFLPLPFFP